MEVVEYKLVSTVKYAAVTISLCLLVDHNILIWQNNSVFL